MNLKTEALRQAREQFEYVDFDDYSKDEIIGDVASLMTGFAEEMLREQGEESESFSGSSISDAVQRYKKKPIAIEAVLLTPDNLETVAAWCGGSVKGVKLPPAKRCIDIQTLEGEMRAEVGVYVIKGIKGEFYPCQPDIFEASYDKA